MKRRVQRYEDTAANWAAADPILPAGWEGIESDTGREKHGDGSTAWNSLMYSGSGIIRLGSKTINLLTVTKQTFFTVPNGFIAIPLSYICRNPSTDLGGAQGTISFGFDVGATDMAQVLSRQDLNYLTQSRQCIGRSIFAAGGFDVAAFIRGGAGDIFGCIVDSGDTAATVDIDIFGYFINV